MFLFIYENRILGFDNIASSNSPQMDQVSRLVLVLIKEDVKQLKTFVNLM